MKILTPISFIFDCIGRLASKLFKSGHVPSVSEEDLYEIIETMVDDGAVEDDRGQLIHSAPDPYFGLFQAVMPLIGYLVGSQFSDMTVSFDHRIAFALLGFIGGK